ncbi:MAG: histidine kinase [Chitinophagaceae bacterium]|nr:histidine kinase [Chitinophagaceae bacterium]
MQKAAFLIKYKLHHLFFWMMVLGLWYFLRYEDYSTGAKAFHVTLIKVADLALMVYLTNYLLIPKLLYKRKYFLFGAAFIFMILTSSIAKMNILACVTSTPALLTLSGNFKARVYDNVIPHFFLVLSGAAFKLMTDYTNMQQRMVEMAKEKAEAELNFLKSQINPHFLFNSLNAVYFLIDKNNTDARGALHKFSAMLRYQLYEMNGDRVPVEKEVAYLGDYIDLQRLRKDENYAVSFNCSPGVKGFSIEPLLLIPFVENAFKHISHHKNQLNFIKLDLHREAGVFHFKLENSKEAIAKINDEHSGIGLNNVQRRLELLYPGKHQLKITNNPDIFIVDLAINI